MLIILCSSAEAEEFSSKQLIPLLQQGGYVLYWRHAATDQKQKDAVDMSLDDCSTQRNLSELGRHQAVNIGKQLTRLKVDVDRVISSPYCRCKETAILAFDRVELDTDLYFSIDVSKDKRGKQTEKLRFLLGNLPGNGKNHVIVSHTANLKEAADVWPKPEAVIHVFKPESDHFTHLGKILPDEWINLN
ncbi:hypothetical protein A9Q99_00030 [Gammaproteobacteria bacterium 45_16_T64]|nr:hypothetical protein A9Q99_00030 [Gammaproteobacteria bacterium 45_16_T64]